MFGLLLIILKKTIWIGFVIQSYFLHSSYSSVQKNLTPSLPSNAITSAFFCNSNVFRDLESNASSRPANSDRRIEKQLGITVRVCSNNLIWSDLHFERYLLELIHRMCTLYWSSHYLKWTCIWGYPILQVSSNK